MRSQEKTSFLTKNDQKIICDKVEKKLYIKIVCFLEQYHQEKHSSNYWYSLIGPWLNKFIKVAFFRYHASNRALKKIISQKNQNDISFIPQDSFDALWKFSNPHWNAQFIKISKNIWQSKKWFYSREQKQPQVVMENPYLTKKATNVFLKKSLYKIFIQHKKVFIINSYLGRLKEFFLNLKMGEVSLPNFRNEKIKIEPCNIDGRFQFICKKKTRKKTFFKYAEQIFPLCLPNCFLESYINYKNAAERELFPISPKIVFTSNNFEFDEVFKFWVAIQKEKNKTNYIIGQHGANYGSYRFTDPYPEEQIPNSFITWGWKKKNKHIPGFIFSMPQPPAQINLFAHKMLLILKDSPLCIETWDTFQEYDDYLKNQFLFVESLSEPVFSKTFLRFYPGHCFTEWNERKLWRKRFPLLNIDINKKIFNFINPWKCIVFSYESTAFLESLVCNMPTFGYFQGGLENIRKAVLPLYKKLIRNSILFETPEECAKFISKNWECLNLIWRSSQIQKAKNSFCNELCRPSARPVTDIYNILKKELNYENSWNK